MGAPLLIWLKNGPKFRDYQEEFLKKKPFFMLKKQGETARSKEML